MLALLSSAWVVPGLIGPAISGLIADQLGGREFLIGDTITVADCYLFVMLMWAGKMGVTLPEPLPAYAERLGARPAVQQALREEGLA